jgi:VWFA-related protein
MCGAGVAAACLALAAAQQPTFRSGVEYVQLDAVVTDTNDRPVGGLTQADFEIVERGKPQTIASFRFVSIPPTRRTVADVKAAVPTIDVASNAHSPAGRQWVLVIDDLHIIEQHLLLTKKVVQAFLESLPADDQLAIVFVGRSDLSQDFTSDLGAQIRTVDRIKASLGFAYDAADHGGGDAVPRVAAADRHRYGIDTTDVLKNVAAGLARSTYSRKAIVYVSEGITYPLVGFGDYASDVIDQWHESFDVARKAGVPIYSLDPRGIPDCTAVRGDCGSEPPRENIQNQQDHLRELAENTAGRAFVNRADTVEAVRELVDDNNSFYLLGYYPEPLERDGKFHTVDVKVKGRPDLRVRARAGYTAPKAAKANATDTKQTLDDALGAALPVAGLDLRAAAAPVAIGEKGMTTAVTLEVTYPDLPPTTFDDSLHFGIVALDHDGKIKAQMRGTYDYTATPKPGQPVSYLINAPIDLPAQPLTLRIAIASSTLDRVASIHLPVEVMNPNRDMLQIGAIAIGFAGPPRQTAVPPDALKGLVPIQPTLVRAFTRSDALRIHVPLFWRGVEGAPAIATIAIKRGDATVRGTHVTVAGASANSRTVSRAQQAAVDGSLSLGDLAAGDYTLEIEARLASGGPVARRAVSFAVR